MITLWELGGKEGRRYSLFSWRTRMALTHKGLAFETQPVCMSDKAAIAFSSGKTVPHQRPIYGRMYQAPFSDWVRNEVGIATMTVGAVTTPDQVNTLLASGKADLVALARPHLANPYFTLQASAWYQHLPQYWPPQYLSGRDQAFRNAPRERAEQTELRLKARPASHEVKDSKKAA